jgi:alcohol dehydrogenase class IV
MASIFTFPTRIRFGGGERAALVPELTRLGVEYPLVVTDPGVARLPMAQELLEGLPRKVVFADVHTNPTEGDVLAALQVYRDNACDGVVGIGGGSALDAAKAARLLVTHPGKLADYDYTSGGMERITPEMPPMVAIPTTAGTGSEAGRGALIQVPETGRKLAAISAYLLPSASICDPELTLSMPPALTAGSGMDALSHCIESFLSTTYHPICDGLALEGLKHIARGLEAAVRDGRDLRARHEMLMGSLLGGISFHKGLGVIHSLSHALGADGRAHHGTLNAILLPHALRFNLPAAEEGLAELATYMGVGRGLHGPGHLITLTELVLARLPLPQRLGAMPGLDQRRIPEYARLAILDHCHRTNPRPCSLQDMETLLERAW